MPDPLPVQSVNHIARVTHDLEASRKFYRDVLGFREVWRPGFQFPGAWLYNYGVMIHLIATADQAPPSKPIGTRADHVALHTEDIDRVQQLLGEHGIPFKSNYVPDTGVLQLFFHDPDGNHIEIGTYSPVRELDE